MGIPYSKQINAAFDQVTPLVAAGFEVLQTTKNISILLAAIQVLTVLLLLLILITMLALLVTMNPDLSEERQVIVTPVMKWFTCFLMPECETRGRLAFAFGLVLTATLFTAGCVMWGYSTDIQAHMPEPDEAGPVDEGEEIGEEPAEGDKKEDEKMGKEKDKKKGKK